MRMLATVTTWDGSVSGAMTDVGDLLTSCITMLAGQPILVVMLGCAVAGIGLKLFKKAKGAVK